jgi:hypothetical protein
VAAYGPPLRHSFALKMADCGDAKFFQIVGRQLRQDAQVDLVLA